jgi:hypothetical protein
MQHAIVLQDEWLAARKALLAKEKEFTKVRDRLSEARRALPWVKVGKITCSTARTVAKPCPTCLAARASSSFITLCLARVGFRAARMEIQVGVVTRH